MMMMVGGKSELSALYQKCPCSALNIDEIHGSNNNSHTRTHTHKRRSKEKNT
jgi:hypothetical protein